MIDYAEVGLIAGLEVHQQLLTPTKMFCRCPAGHYTDAHDGAVLRHMRPTLSELGEYDGCALMEFKTRKNIIYLLHEENVCTYEMDDTPPFLVNQEAVNIAIEQCLMLGCDIVDEVHIARKQYLDGSIPTGFQRTAIVGVNGRLPFRGRELTITQVSVEEDSCREVSDKGHLIVWRTDRLGMPLIETVTGADLRTPDEVEEAILLIGRVCRSTRHVRTGLGASRQDVNVSVRGGRRVEIKGVPKAGWAPRLVHGEAVRQVNLLKLRDDLLARGFTEASSIGVASADVTDVFATSELSFLRQEKWERWIKEQGRRPGFELGAGPFCVRAVRLRGLAGTLSWPTQPEQTFASELAGRVRVIAGLDQRPIMLQSEKWPDYRGAIQELRKVRARLHCESADAVIVIWGPEEDTVTAANEVHLRYVDAIRGIPNETRQPFPDGTTDFERILPGPDRMYPDTDSPPTRVTRERVEHLRAGLPEPPWAREERYAGAGVATSRDPLPDPPRRGGYGRPAGARNRSRPKEDLLSVWREAGLPAARRSAGRRHPVRALGGIVPSLDGIPLLREAWELIVRRVAATPAGSVSDVVAGQGLGLEPSGWRARIPEIVERAESRAYSSDRDRIFRIALGDAMGALRGRVPAAEVGAELRRALEERS